MRSTLVKLAFITLGLLSACVTTTAGQYPPFIKAALQGNISEAEKLLLEGQLVTQTTIGNQTALHVAAAEGEIEMVKWLLAREANPFALDQNGNSPADFANSQGQFRTEEILRDYMALIEDM